MLLINDRYLFVHVPHTGGTTVRNVFSIAMDCRLKSIGNGHAAPIAEHRKKYQRLTVVRHPAMWLRSAYHFIVRGGNLTNKPIEASAKQHRDVNSYIHDLYGAHRSNIVYSAFVDATKKADKELPVEILRSENLAGGLRNFIRSNIELEDNLDVRQYWLIMANPSNTSQGLQRLTRETIDLVADREEAFCHRFGYI